MRNPWMSKNPFMSLWLSTANRVAGTLRGQATAQARRQVVAAITDAMPAVPPKPRPKPVAAAKSKAKARR